MVDPTTQESEEKNMRDQQAMFDDDPGDNWLRLPKKKKTKSHFRTV
jgi:hypothetical protein